MRSFGTSLIVLVLLFSVGISATRCAETGEPREIPEEIEQLKEAVAKANNGFGLDLYGKLSKKEGNLFFSPHSISVALAMTWAGARGETAEQMRAMLRLPERREAVHTAYSHLLDELNEATNAEGCRLEVANALWGQKGYGFLQGYLRLVETNYDAGLEQVDFRNATEKAREQINRWVEKKTNDKIEDLIPRGALNALTRLVLTNAIYFKGLWDMPFKPEQTEDRDFWVSADEKKSVPTMHNKKRFGYAETDDCQLIELPYEGDELSMIVALPRERDGLGEMEKALTQEKLNEWFDGLRRREVDVYLPRFKFTSEFGLRSMLESLGMKDAFLPDEADFSGMNGKRDLFVTAVLHKAYVDVNEEGTEAAAATGVIVGTTSVPLQPAVFRADHPFLFFIRHRPTGTVLFMGRVAEPGLGQ